MNENEKVVLEGTENVEAETTEEITEQVEQIETPEEKVYTESEFNAKLDEVLGKKIARREAKIRKEYDKKYGELESVLKAGTGKKDVDELTDSFKQYYESKGVQIPNRPNYSAKDIEVLASAEAKEIISAGYEDVVEEVDRLAAIGVDKMTAREKAVFKALAEHRQNAERVNELSALGVTADVYDSKEFKDFSAKFGANTPVKEIYEIYNKMQPKKEFTTMGSMKGITSKEEVKDFYSVEEARKFTKQDFDRNPELLKAVERSMQKW